MEGKGVVDFFRQLIFGRDTATNTVKKNLKKYGDKKIKSIQIVRQPISSGIQKMLDYLTLGKIKKDMVAQGYDRLFHLSSVIGIEGGPNLRLEKNETVDLRPVGKFHKESEFRTVPVSGDITLNEAYENIRKLYDDDKNFYGYDSIKNNCQLFIRKFLISNKKNFKYKPSDLDFISQDIAFIAKKYPYTSKIARVLTDIANKLGVLTGDGKKNISNNNIKMLGYCVKCKSKKEIKNGKITNGKRRMLKGVCPTCGTKMIRFLKKGEKVKGGNIDGGATCKGLTPAEIQQTGLKTSGTSKEISKSFKKASIKFHPDKADRNNMTKDEAGKFFQRLTCSYETAFKRAKAQEDKAKEPKPEAPKPKPKPEAPKPKPKPEEPKKEEPKQEEPKEEFNFSSEEQMDDVIDTKKEKSTVEKALIAGAIAITVAGVVWGVNKFRKWLKKKKDKKKKKQKGGEMSAVEKKFNKWMHGGAQQSLTGVMEQQTADGCCKCRGGARNTLTGVSNQGPADDATTGGSSRMYNAGFKKVF